MDLNYSRLAGTSLTIKSVQSTLSHLQSPPEQMQSQRNYGSFLPKIAQNVEDSGLIEQFAVSRSSISSRGSNCDMFEITASVNTESSFAMKEKKAYHSH